MKKALCPITNQIQDCKNCIEIKDGEVCILWEPEEYSYKWATRFATFMRKRVEKRINEKK